MDKRIKKGTKILVKTRPYNWPVAVEAEVTRVEGDNVFLTAGSWVKRHDEDKNWVRANSPSADEFRAAIDKEREAFIAEREVRAKREEEETKQRCEREKQERDERTVTELRAAWQLVDRAEVPKDLRRVAFRFALLRHAYTGWR